MSSRYHEMMKSKNFLPFPLDRITPEMVQKAEKELKETQANRGPALEQFREMILAEEKFNCPMDDHYLMQFLRARKFDVKRAFSLLQNKYHVKKEYDEVYGDIDLDAVRSLMRDGPTCCLPYRDEDGCVVLIFKIAKWDVDKHNLMTALLGMTVMILYCVDDPATQICGVRILLDVQGFSFRMMRCLTPRYINLFAKALRNCLPVRFKGIHIYNESRIFTYIWNIFKIFLTEKLNKRVYFHGDNQKNLQKTIPKEILSGDYGGDNREFSNSEWCKNIEAFYDKFKIIMKSGYDD